MAEGVKKKAAFFLRAAVSGTILFWIFSKLDVHGLLKAVGKISFETWALALLLYLASQLVSSQRWRIIADILGFSGGYLAFVVFYFVAMFFNLFLPSSIGGDVLKVFFLSGKGTAGKLKATYSVFLDRAFGVSAMFLIGAIALGSCPGDLSARWKFFIVTVSVGSILFMVTAPFLWKSLEGRKGNKTPANGVIQRFFLPFFLAWRDPLKVVTVFVLSLAVQVLGMSAVYFLGSGMGLNLPFTFYLAVLPVINIAALLPVSISGFGVREGAFVYFFTSNGVSLASSVGLSLAMFGMQAAVSLIGGLGYILGIHKTIHLKGDGVV